MIVESISYRSDSSTRLFLLGRSPIIDGQPFCIYADIHQMSYLFFA